VNIEQLLGTVRAGWEAQLRAPEDVASVDAERDQLPKDASVDDEPLRRSPRLR
jgi:hypothetical protein